jgi:hypothetical protein
MDTLSPAASQVPWAWVSSSLRRIPRSSSLVVVGHIGQHDRLQRLGGSQPVWRRPLVGNARPATTSVDRGGSSIGP